LDKIFGIDLGTTFSEIAYLKDRKPVVVKLENGIQYLPSVVGLDDSGKIITGFAARNQYLAFPEKTVVSVKRKMGSSEILTMGEKSYTPAEISAEILKTLKFYAEEETGSPVKKAVITVPAYFTDVQRKDTIKAGELAGLEVVRIINEPTAAALAYGCREDKAEKILVYDLGGGTFDISLILIEESIIEVLATDGDSRLGGDDFDARLEDFFVSHLPKETAVNDNLKLRARLKNTAEAIKIKLSTETRAEVNERFITSHRGRPINLKLSVARSEFENLIDAELDKTFKLVKKVIKEGKLKNKDITKILLVGGSTYVPKIFDTLRDNFNFNVHREVDPTYCVAIGAAIQGGIISGEEIDTILVDVNSHSLGIRCLNSRPTGYVDYDYYSIIIHKNTPLPTSMSHIYYTSVENQREIDIEAFQGENPAASKNTFIGSFVLKKLPKKLPEGSKIDVNFEYNLNGVVEISALEKTSGRKEKMRIDINRLKREDSVSEESEEEWINKKKKAERVIRTAKKKLKIVEDPELHETINSIIVTMERLLAKKNKNIEKKAEELAQIIAEI